MQQALASACSSLLPTLLTSAPQPPPPPRPLLSVVLCPGSRSLSPRGQGASVGAISKLCDLGKHRASSPLCEMEITSQNCDGEMKQYMKTQNVQNYPTGSGCCYCLGSRLGVPSFGKPVLFQGVVILCLLLWLSWAHGGSAKDRASAFISASAGSGTASLVVNLSGKAQAGRKVGADVASPSW